MVFKELVKHYAYELGADLVGFGGIDRCRNAPLMMSPQGLLPGARTVVVMALRHPDGCIEMGGEAHPQEIGPYSVQYHMNILLDEMSYRMATFLERHGHRTIPIFSSNIWRYNGYKNLHSVFAPDVSHIYMAVVAGLADIGFSGLALTPEFGARNRFVTVITTASIEEDPLVPPGTVCDQCMLCREHCPSQALSKEIDGWNVLKIAQYEYRFPRKNLWRCAWGEHFELDLDLEIPEVVNEQVILEEIRRHGIRSGEMGQCLKFCVPRDRRSFVPGYSRSPVRAGGITCDESLESRALVDRLLAGLYAGGSSHVAVWGVEELSAAGISIEQYLPGAKSAVTAMIESPVEARAADVDGPTEMFDLGASFLLNSMCYRLTRSFEDLGFRSVTALEQDLTARLLERQGLRDDGRWIANTVVTRKSISSRSPADSGSTIVRVDTGDRTADVTSTVRRFAESLGADLFGIAPVARLEAIATQLRPMFDHQQILNAEDNSIRFRPWEGSISVQSRRVPAPADYLADASSVIVFGLRYHREVVKQATRPPAQAVGPYAFQTYITNWLGAGLGVRLIQMLNSLGYKAVMSGDLFNTASYAANTRGPQHDLFANRFAALGAGLGYLTTSGHLATPQFGICQRFVAIVTDAPLQASPLYRPTAENYHCDSCSRMCLATCPTGAIRKRQLRIVCEGAEYRFNEIDSQRCDWCKRYALVGESGFKYLGSPADVQPPEVITPAALAEALRQHDPIKRYMPAVAEPCVINCPLALKE